ncbi:hypothetical protein [Campylobacter helveticus]|nr:hypothetical protein [Campylobacter helveticus]MCR2062495.1 hypothetical protein [Campylobacter helveticus]MCR2066868.1 hypothetical protein [Campylobacter helveticus]
MQFNQKKQCYDEVYFSDLSDKAQNHISKTLFKRKSKMQQEENQ